MTERNRIERLEINLSLQFYYQEQIISELVAQDAILVLGKGMGIGQIAANLLHVLNLSTTKEKNSLILLINASEEENNLIEEEIMELSWLHQDKHESFPNFYSILGDITTVDKRRAIYSKGRHRISI